VLKLYLKIQWIYKFLCTCRRNSNKYLFFTIKIKKRKEIYVGTRVIFFTFVNLIKLPFYIHLSMMNLETFKQSMILVPLAIIGIYIGYRILKIIDEKLFYNIIYILILFSSSKLLYDYLIKYV
jgi:hypothetical protein